MIKQLTLALLCVCFCSISFAQTNHQIDVGNGNNTFSPSALTIDVGDSVTWVNNGGFHNVNGTAADFPNNPVAFDNGAASSMLWSYGFRFTVAGTYNYQCDPHSGLGMTGTITVNAAAVATKALILTGVIDGPLPGGSPKAIEFYALDDIPDLSVFGFGSANNGGGTDSVEFVFPADAVTAGSYVYVTSDSADFEQFFGFTANYVDTQGNFAVFVNGDDAVELFENGVVIDVFGDINVDGNGTPWEYLDSWAYRNCSTGPDDSTFVLANWTFGGANALDGDTLNSTSMTPMPIGTYMEMCPPPPSTKALILTGVIDGPLPGGSPKAIEFYALDDIPDLSVFGFGSANNGGGTDSVEFVFPADAVTAGNYVYVTSDSADFEQFFGFTANYVDTQGNFAVFVNGDDAVELFENGVVIDVFGDINVDGNGTPWEYLDSWAYRKCSTGPDDTTFVLANWEFGGANALDGDTLNSTSMTPMPIGTYMEMCPPPSNLAKSLIVTGLADGPLPGGHPKAIEFYALDNIPDLSVYGFGSANNGGGTDSVEFVFPADSVGAGTYITVTSDTAAFEQFFGFTATYVDTQGNFAVFVNGDDAVEVFENGVVIDVFGDINVDGNGEPWEYLDSWAYRRCSTGPDDTTFVLGNWEFGGVDNYDGDTLNATSMNPMPIGTYSPMCPAEPEAVNDMAMTDQDMAVTIDVLANDNIPSMLDSLVIIGGPTNGTAVANGLMDVTYTPDSGYCGGVDTFWYAIYDMIGADTAMVMVTVECPISYPYYTIATVHTEDGTGVADSLEVTCELRGVVYGVNWRPNGLSFTMIDQTGGINVFSFDPVSGYTVTEGDSIHVWGEIDQFNGLTEIIPDSVEMISQGNTLKMPTVVVALGEDTESDLVQLEGWTFPDTSQWTGSGSGFNVDVTNGTDTLVIRIDNDVDLYSAPKPDPNATYRIIGIGGQFDSSDPRDEGYQLQPRYMADLILSTGIEKVDLSSAIKFYPNPAQRNLTIETEIALDAIRITDMFGKQLMFVERPDARTQLDISQLAAGMYTISFMNEKGLWAQPLMIRR